LARVNSLLLWHSTADQAGHSELVRQGQFVENPLRAEKVSFSKASLRFAN
jgi:hypothetical protein